MPVMEPTSYLRWRNTVLEQLWQPVYLSMTIGPRGETVAKREFVAGSGEWRKVPTAEEST